MPAESKVDVSIDFSKTNLENAIDHYYSFLKVVIASDKFGPNQKVALTNTIQSIPFIEKKKYYNAQLFRAFADLTARNRNNLSEDISPIEGESIDNLLGAADIAAAWSSEYLSYALPYVLKKVKDKLSDEDRLKINNLEGDYETAYESYLEKLEELDLSWITYAETKGISSDDGESYWVEYRKWWSRRNGIVKIRWNKARRIQSNIELTLKSVLTPDDIWLKNIRDGLLEVNQLALPTDPELNDETTAVFNYTPGLWDVRPVIRPTGFGNFDIFLKDGEASGSNEFPEKSEILDILDDNERSYYVSSQAKATYKHDTDWQTTANVGYGFFKASVSISQKKHFDDAAEKLLGLKVGFKKIEEMPVVRDKWFSLRLLNDPGFLEYVEEHNPTAIATLEHCVVSLIVVRGLCLQLVFEDSYDMTAWEKLSISGSGGISIGGWKFGLNGHYNESEHWTKHTLDQNSIAFCDRPDVCRVVGMRIEQVIGDQENAIVKLDASKKNNVSEEFLNGAISYDQFINSDSIIKDKGYIF